MTTVLPEPIHPTIARVRLINVTIGLGVFLITILMSMAISIASASSIGPNTGDLPSTLPLQITATPTATLQIEAPTIFSVTLATLGYDDKTLSSPFDKAEYSFRLPETWTIEDGSTLNLDFGYAYDQTYSAESPVFFGDLTISLNGRTLDIISIDKESELSQVSIPVPTSLLTDPDQTQHAIEVVLDAGFLCEVPHKAKVVIKPTSSISLNYSQQPLLPDLSRYPQPFYQRAFDQRDSVRFVFPSQITDNNVTDAIAVAGKLGDLTGNRMIINATTDVDLIRPLFNPTAVSDEHLIVIGRPQEHQLLSFLNNSLDLPVSLHRQELDLIIEGPVNVVPGDTLTYLISVTNTDNRDVNLSVFNPLSPYTELVDCKPNCIENRDKGTVVWSGNRLAPAETLSLSLSLKASDTLTKGMALEHTITVVEAGLRPVNADTLLTAVVKNLAGDERQVSVTKEGDYFFMFNDQAVSENDGIIQEIISPWNQDRAILIITGLNDEAVRKASQAMSSETQFPGMNGAVALVKDTLSPSTALETTDVEITLADLGYSDKVVQGGGDVREIEYSFELPYGWQLTDDAYIDLFFTHSKFIDFANSGLIVFLNRQPIASATLSDQTSDNGHIHIDLADAKIQPGQTNLLSIEVDAVLPGVCTDDKRAWVLIKNSSMMFLAHNENPSPDLNFHSYPNPFHLNPSLSDVLFVVPDTPTVDELENVLRLAAALGNSAGGKTLLPPTKMGDIPPSKDINDYQIIALGRSSRNSFIQENNDKLPQPFISGTDEIEQILDEIVFRLPPGIDLGYIQLLPSPWNENRAFLVVTGTTDQSVNWAADILAYRPWALGNGDLAIIQQDEIKTIDTRKLTQSGVAAAVVTAVPETIPMTDTVAATVTRLPASPGPSPEITVIESASQAQEPENPAWLIPLVGLTSLLVIAIFATALWQAKHRSSK